MNLHPLVTAAAEVFLVVALELGALIAVAWV